MLVVVVVVVVCRVLLARMIRSGDWFGPCFKPAFFTICGKAKTSS